MAKAKIPNKWRFACMQIDTSGLEPGFTSAGLLARYVYWLFTIATSYWLSNTEKLPSVVCTAESYLSAFTLYNSIHNMAAHA